LQSPAKTIKEALDDNWQAWGTLKKSSINFVYGAPISPEMRFAKHKLSMEVKDLVDPIIKKSLARSVHKDVIQVDAWLQVLELDEKKKADLLDDMQLIKDEVERIIKLKQKTLTGIRLAYPRSWQPLNNLSSEEEGPYLRSVLYVVCVYEKP